MIDAVFGEEVVDLTLKHAQTPVSVLSFGLQTAFRLHKLIDNTGCDERFSRARGRFR